ncbi:MAG: hypothetical protein JSS30_02255 [Verrucomicrobia bacterium]|nr:hypothetical protein [Verrucomicrobiota bacterium]
MNLILSTIFFLMPILQESIPDGPFQYPGSAPREIILVDPEFSPLMDKAFADLSKHLDRSFSEEKIIELVFLYVREVLFDLNLCNEQQVRTLIHSIHPNEKEPEMALEIFLEHKTGLCRHIALTSSCLINRLIKDRWLHGEVFLIRENCPRGRHAWTLFLSKDGAWHLDSLWGVLENGKTSAGFSRLCDNYGKRIMNEQKKKWEKTTP